MRYHGISNRAEARAIELLGEVRLPDPQAMVDRCPHQLSGGQQQRIVIAMALGRKPDLIILDEPTTGLGVTTEVVILDLINDPRHKTNTSFLFTSHNIAVIAKICHRVGVLYAGEFVEEGAFADVIRRPRHPYTVGLIASMPSRSLPASGLSRSAAACRTLRACRRGASSPIAAAERPGRLPRCKAAGGRRRRRAFRPLSSSREGEGGGTGA